LSYTFGTRRDDMTHPKIVTR